MAHAIVRSARPGVVVEVGSGFSTRVLRGALDRNGVGTLVSIDPRPRLEPEGVAHETRREPVQGVPVEYFESLSSDSVLFIDSSHRVGSGTDVSYLFLEVLPALRPGVLVHVHDVYLPEDYPADLNLGPAGWNFNEQHLLHALLIGSELFDVEWPARLVVTERRRDLEALFPEPAELAMHCSFWMRRRETA